jgi:hypothetical protein
MHRAKLRKLQNRNQAEGDLRQAEERAYGRQIRETAWRFDPSQAQIFDVQVWPATNDKELSVYVCIGSEQHHRVMPNNKRSWREIGALAARASSGFYNHTEGAK